MTFAEKIVVVSRERRLNLTELARNAGISYQTLRNYLKPDSKTKPYTPTAIALAKALGVSILWLFDDSRGLPPSPYQEDPPVPIYPWPPDITWDEVQSAIAAYVFEMYYQKMTSRVKARPRSKYPHQAVVEQLFQHLQDVQTTPGRERAWKRASPPANPNPEKP